jgi:hypothetical protein
MIGRLRRPKWARRRRQYFDAAALAALWINLTQQAFGRRP